VRELQVRKFRGSGFMEGRHAFQITDAGLVAYPRTEALPISPPIERGLHLRMSLGVPQLDEMLSGGLLSSSMTMLLGVPGSGKTLLGLQFLGKGAAEKQRGLYFGFNEGPLEVIDSAAHIGLDFTAYLAENLLEVIRQSPIEGILDSLANRLLEAVRQRQVQRLFIDGLAGFQTAADYPGRIDRFLKMLTDELRALNVTTVFSVELNNLFGPTIEIPIKGISVLTDNILFLRYAELHSHLIRLVSILKTRRSGNDPAIREFRITDKGIAVADTFTSVEAILSGFASPAADVTAVTAQMRRS
jgi:circadian clock protein KaiC